MAKRTRITGNLTPLKALVLLPRVTEARSRVEHAAAFGVIASVLRDVERTLIDHVGAGLRRKR